jgi:hypothetical protein
MVKVHYNGINPFSGIAPTPFVAINEEMINYGQRWGTVQKIGLKGMLTGACNPSSGNNELFVRQQALLSGFSRDFKTLEIIDSNSTVFSAPYAKIDNISFDASPYVAGLPFKIDITAFPSGMFSGVYGITDPVSTIKYSQQNNGIVNITRNISAKGFNTSNTVNNNALDNARNYVQSLTGNGAQIISPAFISLAPNLCPRKITETINRLEGTYAVDIDYTQRKNATSSILLTYTTDIGYEEERGIYNISLKGSLNGGECRDMQSLRSAYSELQPYNRVMTRFAQQVTGAPAINPTPDSFSVDEDESSNNINFSYSYTTDPEEVRFDYTLDVQNNYITDSATASINGVFIPRGPQATRMQKAEAALSGFNPLPICRAAYLQNITLGSVPLNTNYKSYNVTRDLTTNTIKVNAAFDNSPMPIAGAKQFNWTVSVVPSLWSFYPVQFLNGGNGYFNLNYYKRGKVSLNGTAIYTDSTDYTETVRSNANSLALKYVGANSVLVESKVERKTKSEDNGYAYSFNIEYACETTIFTIP